MPTVLFFSLLAGCAGPSGEPVASPGPSAIIVVLDGVRVDEFSSAESSTLTGVPGEVFADRVWAGLGSDAAVVRAGLNDAVTITGPAHAAMVTGAWEEFANLPVNVEVGPGSYRTVLPNLFEEAATQLGFGPDEVVLLGNSELVSPMDYSLYPGYGPGIGASYELVEDPKKNGAPSQDDNEVFEAFKQHILDGPPRVMIGNVHDVDRAGHYGDEDDYYQGVQDIDGFLAAFWGWLQVEQPDYAEDLLLVVTSDHGRHDHEDDSGWHNHGDACVGCREVPLFVAGGGATAGVVDEGRYTLTDLAPTIAAHVGFDLPFAEGLPLSRLFDGAEMPARSGLRDIAVSGALQAEARFADDYDARTAVFAGDSQLSTPGALRAEDPVVLDGEGDYACFRELLLEDDALEWPWTGRCFARIDDAWVDIGFPDAEVSPFWRPALVEEDGVLHASWSYNPNFIGELGADGDVGVRSARWTAADGWTYEAPWVTYVPTGVSRAGDWVAFVTNEGDADARYTRAVHVGRVGEDTRSFALGNLLGEDTRVESPAVRAGGQGAAVAMLGTGGDGWVLAWAETEDGGSWSDPVQVVATGEILPHLGPHWDGDELYWAELVDGVSHVCHDAAAPTCLSTGSARIRDFEVDSGVVYAVVDAGAGQWELRTL